MYDVLTFLSGREKGFLESKKCLNSDFLLEKLACKKEDAFLLQNHSGEYVPPYVCQFRKDKCSGDVEILAVATEDGDIMLIDSGNCLKSKVVHTWNAHDNAILDVCWLPDSPKLITAGGDQTVVLWDTITGKNIIKFTGHTGSIKCIDICPGQSSIFATGSRDGSVKVWDTRMQNSSCCGLITKPEFTIFSCLENKPKVNNTRAKWKNPLVSKVSRSVTCVAFQNSNYLASATCSETAIKIWDMRRTYCEKPKIHPLPKHVLPYSAKSKHGSAHMVFDSPRQILYVCSTDNSIYALNCHSYSAESIPVYRGLQAKTFFIKIALSADDKFLLSGSSDEKAYIWNVSKPGLPVAKLEGHNAEVTAVAWHSFNYSSLATCGDDNKVMVWKVSKTELQSEELVGCAKILQPDLNLSPQKKLNEPQISALEVTNTSQRPLKECSLTHFFSNLNTSTPNSDSHSLNNSVVQRDIKDFNYDENNCMFPKRNEISSSVGHSKNLDTPIKIKDKENITNISSSLLQFKGDKAQLKSPLRKSGKKKNKITSTNSPPSKKIKTSSFKDNLITSYFQR